MKRHFFGSDPIGTRRGRVPVALLALTLLVGSSCREKATRSDVAVADPGPQAAQEHTPASRTNAAAEPVRARDAKPKPEPPYNVLLIMIDSLRADMPWAGYPRPIAPWLSAFAEKSTLYPRAYALSSYTAKSVVPALVGAYSGELHRDGYFFTKWQPENLLISERAKESGHRTLSGQAHGYFLPNLGVSQGFDDYQLLPGTFLDVKGVETITSEKLTKLAKKMLSDPKNVDLPEPKRFFAYFHYLDPHYTYFKHAEHPDFGNKRRDLYDNEVHYTDKWVGVLVDWVLEQPWAKHTAIIITSDHGEGFGERGHYRHAYEVWEALVRVPLFIHVPKAKAQRVELARGHIDLAPTIAELMGLAANPPFRGMSLLPEVFGDLQPARPVLVDMARSDLMDRRRALVMGDYKLIVFGDDKSFELYKVTEDFREENELSSSEPEKLAELKTAYLGLTKGIPNVPVVGAAPLKGARSGQRW